jgi:dihydroxyacetone kinase phosphotransfer subunit
VVGLVLVSHSAQLAAGLLEMVQQITRVSSGVIAVGGLADGSLGTSAEAIRRALDALDGPDGVLVLMDLGSAVLTTESVLDELPEAQRRRVRLSNAPLVEGALAAAMQAALGAPLAEVADAAEAAGRVPKVLG